MAHAAKVSVATVSRVVNEKAPVREETRRRIRRAIDKLRYVPHGVARSLITRKTHTVGVLLPDLFGEFFSELIRGIDLAARKGGYHLLVSSSHGSSSETQAMVRAMRGRVDGLIVFSPDLDVPALEANLPAGFPVVLLNGKGKKRTSDSILVDNYGGARAVMKHLLGLGHRRIAFVGGPPRNHDAAERLRGYRDALAQAGARPLEAAGDFREEAGYRAAPRLLRGRSSPTAVFAANDAMAIGLLCAFRERQVRVPEDIALAGFDDIPIARFVTPPLTTVRVPIADLGARATARLLHAMGAEAADERRARREEILPTKLVVRSSCGAWLRARPVDVSRRLQEVPSAPSPIPNDDPQTSDSRFETSAKEERR